MTKAHCIWKVLPNGISLKICGQNPFDHSYGEFLEKDFTALDESKKCKRCAKRLSVILKNREDK